MSSPQTPPAPPRPPGRSEHPEKRICVARVAGPARAADWACSAAREARCGKSEAFAPARQRPGSGGGGGVGGGQDGSGKGRPGKAALPLRPTSRPDSAFRVRSPNSALPRISSRSGGLGERNSGGCRDSGASESWGGGRELLAGGRSDTPAPGPGKGVRAAPGRGGVSAASALPRAYLASSPPTPPPRQGRSGRGGGGPAAGLGAPSGRGARGAPGPS